MSKENENKAVQIHTLKDEEKNDAKYTGEMQKNLLAFFSPPLLLVLFIVAGVVGSSFDTLWVYFQTNVALNGLIIGTLLYATYKALSNNFILMKLASFLNDLDVLMDRGDITEEEAQILHGRLNKEGWLMSTTNMHKCLNNLHEFGHINFTDNDARLIKSKLGFRIRLGRGSVGFLSGLMVMLGLLGTFLGLLATIDAVGNAMGSMAAMSADDMSEFIAAIAAPLQGMGLAFSSSLFGLSGSLLSSFFNHVATTSQNSFVEDVSRWIDNRIPYFDPEKAATGKSSGAKAHKDDIIELMAGVSYLTNQTNKRIGELIPVLEQSAQHNAQSANFLEELCNDQKNIYDEVLKTNSNLQVLTQESTSLTSAIQNTMGKNLPEIITLISEGNVQNKEIYKQLEDYSGNIDTGLSALTQNVSQMRETNSDILSKMPSFSGNMDELTQLTSDAKRGIFASASMLKKMLNAQSTVGGSTSNDVDQISATLESLNTTQQTLIEQMMALREDLKDAGIDEKLYSDKLDYVSEQLETIAHKPAKRSSDLEIDENIWPPEIQGSKSKN